MIDRLSFSIIMSFKEAKINFIIDVAIDLFVRQSISDVTIKDIAEKAGIGEATIYRYFAKKESIVLACVMTLQKKVNDKYFVLSKGKTGFDKLAIFYNSYLDIFKETPEYFYFIREFDAYMYSQNHELLENYEKSIDLYRQTYLEAYELGLKDGSIKKNDDIDVFYFSTTHSLLELCKKLSIQKALLTQDKSLQKVGEIQCLINIILSSLKNL